MGGKGRGNGESDAMLVHNADIQSHIKTLVSKICSSDDFINQISEAITASVSVEVRQRLENLERENENLKLQLRKQADTVLTLERTAERLDRAYRSRGIRVYGVKEERNEDITKTVAGIFQKLKLDKSSEMAVEKSYRVGKPRRGKPRPIYVYFSSLEMKKRVYVNKKRLKGTGVVLREDLTPNNLALVRAAVGKVGEAGQVWTSDGRVFVKLHSNNQVVKLSSQDDVDAFQV